MMLVFTLERAFNFDTNMNCMFMSKDGEHAIESQKVRCRELSWEEVDFVLVGLRRPSTLRVTSNVHRVQEGAISHFLSELFRFRQ